MYVKVWIAGKQVCGHHLKIIYVVGGGLVQLKLSSVFWTTTNLLIVLCMTYASAFVLYIHGLHF